jgi:hypothetical protein
VDKLRLAVQSIQVKLFGEDEGENEQGRIPRLEKKVENHGLRLERLVLIVAGILLCLRDIASAADSISRIVSVFK